MDDKRPIHPSLTPAATAAANLHAKCFLDCVTLLNHPEIIEGYPHRYLFLSVRPSQGKLFPQLFTGVELLESRGWEPVAWEIAGAASGYCGAVMRRLEPFTPPPPVDTP